MIPSHLIEIAEQTDCSTIDTQLLEKAVKETLDRFKVEKAAFSIAVVDGQQMRQLNNQYLQHDFDTDVLSFCLHDPADFDESYGDHQDSGLEIEVEEAVDQEEFLPEGDEFGMDRLQGQLIVSLCYAKEKSQELGSSVSEELALYVVHGSLHILGFDDHTAEDRKEMRRLEKEVLGRLSIEPLWPASEMESEEESEQS